MKKEKGIVKKEKGIEQKVEFSFLPLKDATNNLLYWAQLAKENNLEPVDCFLVKRSDHYGSIKDIWSKEIIASYDLSFQEKDGAVKAICFVVDGIDRPRRLYDPLFDNISHVKIGMVDKKKYLILKPLEGEYMAMKNRTQSRIKSIYEKNHLSGK